MLGRVGLFMATAAVLASAMPAAGDICWTNSVGAPGGVCVPAPITLTLRTQHDHVTVRGDGIGTTGVVIVYDIPPSVRVLVLGQEMPPGPIGEVCWSNGIGVGGTGHGEACTLVRGFDGALFVRTQDSHVSICGEVGGRRIGTTGVAVDLSTPPSPRVLVDDGDCPLPRDDP